MGYLLMQILFSIQRPRLVCSIELLDQDTFGCSYAAWSLLLPYAFATQSPKTSDTKRLELRTSEGRGRQPQLTSITTRLSRGGIRSIRSGDGGFECVKFPGRQKSENVLVCGGYCVRTQACFRTVARAAVFVKVTEDNVFKSQNNQILRARSI